MMTTTTRGGGATVGALNYDNVDGIDNNRKEHEVNTIIDKDVMRLRNDDNDNNDDDDEYEYKYEYEDL
jgi:hypothetical protein